MRRSKELKAIEKKYIGKRIKYYIVDVLDKKSGGRKLDGPYTGTVMGCTTNEADIYDRVEGLDHRNSIQFTGGLIVKPDDCIYDEYPWVNHTEIIRE